MVDAVSIGNMTPEEQELAMKLNPVEYYDALFKHSMTHITEHVNQAGAIVGQTINGLVGAFKLHAEELSIFRAWEQEVRNKTFSPDKLITYLDKLTGFRERVQAEITAINNAQPTKPN